VDAILVPTLGNEIQENEEYSTVVNDLEDRYFSSLYTIEIGLHPITLT